ncbi:MAG TPA: hypothetical protein VHF22_04695, partial [Planctomycetota bacterium]|nr:hypothetical protein [Planctomycetota bacterium]
MAARMGALLAVLAVAAATAACGGDGGSGELSREEYVAQADAICERTNEREAALGDAPSSLPVLGDYLEKQKELAEDQLTALRALDPPQELEAQVDEAYGLLDQVVGKIDEAVAAAQAGDVATLTAVGGEAQKLAA